MFKKKALIKEFFISIKKTYNRFLSICLIVMLGAAFFAGIRATNPDMQQSADIFYDQSKLMDIRVVSSLGLTDDDTKAIEQINGVETVEPSYWADVLTNLNDQELVLRLMGKTENINLFTVEEGRMPEKSNECLVDSGLIRQGYYNIGDTITVTSGNDTAIEDVVSETKYTIVGSGKSALYLNMTRDSSQIGHGSVTGFMVIPKDSFSMAAYTEMTVTVSGAKELNCYGNDYEKLIENMTSEIEAISGARCEIRYADVINDAQEQIAEAEDKVADGEKALEDGAEEIAQGESQLDDAKAQVSDGQKQLSDAKAELEVSKTQLESAEAEINSAQAQLSSAKEQINTGLTQLNNQQAVLDSNRNQLNTAKAEIDAGWTEYNTNKEALDQQQSQLNANKQQIEAQAATLAESRSQLEAARPAIDAARTQAASGQIAIDGLNQQINDLNGQMAQLQIDMEAILEQIQQGHTELQGQYDTMEATYNGLSATVSSLTAQRDQLVHQVNGILEQIQSFDNNEQVIINGENAIAQAQADIQVGQVAIDKGYEQLNSGKAALESNEASVNNGLARLNDGQTQINNARQDIASKQALLSQQEKVLSDSIGQLNSGKEQLTIGQQQIADNEKTLATAIEEIAINEEKLNDAKEEYEKAVKENVPDLEAAKVDIEKAKEDLKNIEVPEWYVLDRNYIQTCVEYAQDAERIGNIGEVFPVIFFLVAALVSLTTMTRMVEEERTQIGTLKALGYTKASIAFKYVMYGFLATVIGGTIGTIIGQKVIPIVIMNAYKIMYITLEDFVTPVYASFTWLSLGAAVLCTMAAVIAACYKQLYCVPAQLMRPEAPKIGKRVLLERLTFVWKRLNFSNKAAVRNLFRYKKRFFMTIIGIGGCTGLMLVGFGLKNSIVAIGDNQYTNLRIYQSEINFADDTSEQQRQHVYDQVMAEDNVSDTMLVHEEIVAVGKDTKGTGERSAYMFVPSQLERLDQFVVLRSRIGHEAYELSDNGVIISEKLATLLDVNQGDEIYIEVSEMNWKPVKIDHIVENYFYHYVYLSPTLYESIYKEPFESSSVYVKYNENSLDYEAYFSEKYLNNDQITGITYTRTISERIADMITSMDAIIWVIVISAGLLAFIVLYNLNNINISERRRELATLRVLGFYNSEVSIYVFRENVLLTCIGSVAGLFMGIILHRFVIVTAEVDLMMFGRSIYPSSYVYSILLTVLFSIVVNFVMYRKVKKIDMIESLKSVE